MTPCPHRGPRLRRRKANLCACRRKVFLVYACEKYGECSEHKWHDQVRSCIACQKVAALQRKREADGGSP